MLSDSPKIAVAIVHGVGNAQPDFLEPLRRRILRYFSRELRGLTPHPEEEIVVRSVYWGPVVQGLEDELARRVVEGRSLDYNDLRGFMLSFAGDAIAYQPTGGRKETYNNVHAVFAQTLRELAQEAGETAPLCVVSHSLGTVVSSNYFYDLQMDPVKDLVPEAVKTEMTDTPLERGETFALFYTLGSPIALWSLRYREYGTPLTFPTPALAAHHPKAKSGWFNVYDKDDIIGYPLKTLNTQYQATVTEDVQVNVGRLFSFWNPLSHTHYWESRRLAKRIARQLAELWKNTRQ